MAMTDMIGQCPEGNRTVVQWSDAWRREAGERRLERSRRANGLREVRLAALLGDLGSECALARLHSLGQGMAGALERPLQEGEAGRGRPPRGTGWRCWRPAGG